MNYRVYIISQKEFRKWWVEWKSAEPREWALDTLEWALHNIESESKNRKFVALANSFAESPAACRGDESMPYRRGL